MDEVDIIDSAKDGVLVTKHCYRTATKENWKVETWLNGSSTRVGGAFKISVRLTPQKGHQKKPAVKIYLELARKNTDELIGKSESKLALFDCQEMKKRRETIYYHEKREHSPITHFPPKEKCWENETWVPLNLVPRPGKPRPFDAGIYHLRVKTEIENGPVFVFEGVPIEYYIPGQPGFSY